MVSFQTLSPFLHLLLVLFMVEASASGFSSSGARQAGLSGDVIPNKIVVKFKDAGALGKSATATGWATFDRLLQKYDATRLQQVVSPYNNLRNRTSKVGIESIYYIHFNAASPIEMAAELSQEPLVEYAEPLYYHRLSVTPNDTLFDQQDYFAVIQAEAAWDIVKGEEGDVVIAVVDGGTDIDHQDLQPNLWVNPGEIPDNGLDDDDNGFVDDVHGWNFANDSNDPTGLPSTPNSANHGTLTAGIACAATNNETGVSGTSWNARLLGVNAAAANRDGFIESGYEGILYAVNNGADVISLSWGGGIRSEFGADVVDLATEMGAAVVAAAGNNNTSAPDFPAGYRNVLSVAATGDTDIKTGFSNYGRTVDIAAPGLFIFNTFSNNRYGRLSGTSFACPMVAGVVALVKTQNPDLTGQQAAEQVRIASDNIDSENPSFVKQLGKGRLNALRAETETSPSVRITEVDFVDSSGDGVIEPGETVRVSLRLKNFLESASNVKFTLNEEDPYVELGQRNATLSSIGTMEEVTLVTAFEFDTASDAPSGHPVEFTVDISAGDYSDFDSFVLTILPTFATLGINNIQVTVTNVGRVGFADPVNSADGVGFRFMNSPNLLFEGALIAGTGPGQISNAARGAGQVFDDDFDVAEDGDIRVLTPGTLSDQESVGIFRDTKTSTPLHIRVVQETFANAAAPNDNFVLFKYVIENLNTNTLENFHFGLYLDWDIDDLTSNVADYDDSRRLGYTFDTSSGSPDVYAGISVLNDGGVHYRAYNNRESLDPPDGFTDSEKWQAISGGTTLSNAGPADVSSVIATGPFVIPPNETIEVGFALLAGTDLADLQDNADDATERWEEVADREGPLLPTEFALQPNFPNPFNLNTTIRYDLPEASQVELVVYNVLGQRIRTLVQDQQGPGFHSEDWDGRDDRALPVASGVYIYRLSAGDFVESRKMLLLQ